MSRRIEEGWETPNFMVEAVNRLAFPERETPTGDKERVRIIIRKVTLTCKRSGRAFWFSGQRRQGVLTFGDSRYSEKDSGTILRPRYNALQLRAELARMVGGEIADRAVGIATL